MKKTFTFILAICIAIISIGQEQPHPKQEIPTHILPKKIISSLTAEDDELGKSVEICGNYAFVGSPNDDEKGENSGSVTIFYQESENTWAELSTIYPEDNSADANFGYSISANDSILIIGAPGSTEEGDRTGSVYVHYKDQGGSGTWGFIKKINAEDAEEYNEFGSSVDLWGSTIIVGAFMNDEGGYYCGAAYIYSKNHEGENNWGEVKKLIPSDKGEMYSFGDAVAIYENLAVVGAPGSKDNDIETGALYVFGKDIFGANNWGEIKKVIPSDKQNNTFFGSSIDLYETMVVAGAYNFSSSTMSKKGKVYAFEKDKDGDNNWGEFKTFEASDSAANNQFGYCVKLNKNTIIAGTSNNSYGKVYVFNKHKGGQKKWEEANIISATNEGSKFGKSIAFNKEHLIIGAPEELKDSKNAGNAFIYQRVDKLYVKSDGAGIGLSWDAAMPHIQEASDFLYQNGGGEVWVAEGTYYPQSTNGLDDSDPRNKHYRMYRGVEIYGGFPNTGTPTMKDRDHMNHETTLSGDIDQDGQLNDGNIYHIIYNSQGINDTHTKNWEAVDTTGVIDGFIIEKGNANKLYSNRDKGGSIYTNGGTFSNIKISDCYSESSIVLSTFRSTKEITHYNNLTVESCQVNKGPIVNLEITGNKLFKVNISNNTISSSSKGSIIYSSIGYIDSVTVTNNTVNEIGNNWGDEQGIVYLFKGFIKNSRIANNTSNVYGGGIYNEGGIVESCIIENNTAQLGGGAMGDDYNKVKAEFINCIIRNNTATKEGGGVHGGHYYNCLIYGNEAPTGGGIFNAHLTNCNVYKNHAQVKGGGIYNSSHVGLRELNNSVVWGNTSIDEGNQIYIENNYNIDISNSAIQDYDFSTETNSTNITLSSENTGDEDENYPGFTDPENFNFEISANTSCLINKGNNEYIEDYELDFAKNPRIYNKDIVDIGAYEYQGNPLPEFCEMTSVAGDYGSVTPESKTVDYKASHTYTITPDDNYEIQSADYNGTDVKEQLVKEENSWTFTIDPVLENGKLEVTFSLKTYNLTAVAGDNGDINPKSATVNHGENQEFTISANENYTISTATINDIDILDELTKSEETWIYTAENVTNDAIISVGFKLKSYEVKAKITGKGTVTPNNTSISHGENVSFTITPDEGQYIGSALYNGTDILDQLTKENGSWIFTQNNITEEGVLKITFESFTFEISTIYDENGSVSPDTYTASYGETINFTIIPNDSYEISSAKYNGIDILSNLVKDGNNWKYTKENITENGELMIAFSKKTDVNDISSDNLVIYPNPTNGIFQIKLPVNKSAKVTVFNTVGANIKKILNYNGEKIDIQEFKSGLYFISIDIEGTTRSMKLFLNK